MKFIKLLLLSLALAITAHAADIAPEKRTEIQKMLRLTGVSQLMDQMKSQMIQAYKANMTNVPADFWTKFEAKLDTSELVEQLIPLYDKHYSLEDLRAINAFYESPAGRRVIATLPAIMQESMQLGQAWGTKAGQEAAKAAMAELPKSSATTVQ